MSMVFGREVLSRISALQSQTGQPPKNKNTTDRSYSTRRRTLKEQKMNNNANSNSRLQQYTGPDNVSNANTFEQKRVSDRITMLE